MQTIKNWVFYKDASATSTSADMKPYVNVQADLLAVEVSGTATSMTIKMQGRSNNENNNEWFDLACVDATTFDVKQSISSTGIYNVAIDGIKEVRANITAVSGGSVTIFGCAVNTGV